MVRPVVFRVNLAEFPGLEVDSGSSIFGAPDAQFRLQASAHPVARRSPRYGLAIGIGDPHQHSFVALTAIAPPRPACTGIFATSRVACVSISVAKIAPAFV